MYIYSIGPIIKFVKTNSYLVSNETNKYSAMMNIIKNIPFLANILNESCDDKIESTELEIKTILGEDDFDVSLFSKTELLIGEKYSRLVFRCNILSKEYFYVFRNSVYSLAASMRKEDCSEYKNINEAVYSLLDNFLQNAIDVENNKQSLEDLINTWAPSLD